VLQDPGLLARLEATGTLIVGSTPNAFGREVAELDGQLRRVVAERRPASD
jgi:hypothetical protein